MLLRPNIFFSVLTLAACATSVDADDIPTEQRTVQTIAWDRLWPGDSLAVEVPSAPELSREVTLDLEGLIRFPPLGEFDVAGSDLEEVETVLRAALTDELINPSVSVRRTGNVSHKIFVGGAVRTPGAFELPGRIGLLEAIIMAGDFSGRGADHEVMLIRRGKGGRVSTQTVDLSGGIWDDALSRLGPLRPFDVIYVSTDKIGGEERLGRKGINDLLPIDFAVFFGIS